MKCPNCRSLMFVADETATAKSHVTFYRCSICVSKHVSSEPIAEFTRQVSSQETSAFASAALAQAKTYAMV